MDEERGAYLDRVLIGGREPAEITVVDYDERWPVRFREVAERVRRALGEDALAVEHIGSTSVPGLAAKPIVDVLLTVADVGDEAAYVPALESAGFLLRVREPAHRMVRTPARDVPVHVYEPDRPEVRDYLDLRDWLRVDAEDRALRSDEADAGPAAVGRHERLRRRQDRRHLRHRVPGSGMAGGLHGPSCEELGKSQFPPKPPPQRSGCIAPRCASGSPCGVVTPRAIEPGSSRREPRVPCHASACCLRGQRDVSTVSTGAPTTTPSA